MSDAKDFLSRWSQRKLHPEETQELPAEKKNQAEATGDDGAAPAEPVPEKEFDISKLPSLDSITANSDISAFLQKGVPSSLRHAALRRVWSADPAIRDFVGLSENSWDFNNPDALPGFGPLDTGDVRRLLAQVVGDPLQEILGEDSASNRSAEQAASDKQEMASVRLSDTKLAALDDQTEPKIAKSVSTEPRVDHDKNADVLATEDARDADAAPQHGATDTPRDAPAPRRRHGRALPE